MQTALRILLAAPLLFCSSRCVAAAQDAQGHLPETHSQTKQASGAEFKFNTAEIDAVLGRPGSWVEGIYLVNFPRPDLRVMLEGVRLSDVQVLSFATFMGSGSRAELMGEICALPEEVTPALAKLRAEGFTVSGVHNHFLGESPRLTFVHFMARGKAVNLAQSFIAALGTTKTPLGRTNAMKTGTAPAWTKSVEKTLGRAGYMSDDKSFEIDVPSGDFPAGPMDFWYESTLSFQEASSGKVVATGDLLVTARELNPVLGILLDHGFEIPGVHNHFIDEQPRVFFVHFWKVSAPDDLAMGLKAALAAIHARER